MVEGLFCGAQDSGYMCCSVCVAGGTVYGGEGLFCGVKGRGVLNVTAGSQEKPESSAAASGHQLEPECGPRAPPTRAPAHEHLCLRGAVRERVHHGHVHVEVVRLLKAFAALLARELQLRLRLVLGHVIFE